MQTFFSKVLLLLSVLSLNACFIKPYQFAIEQGNIITQEKIRQIHPGMHPEQVRYLLGTPLLTDVFHLSRWDYVYFQKPSKGQKKRYHLAVYFKEGKVERISHEALPS